MKMDQIKLKKLVGDEWEDISNAIEFSGESIIESEHYNFIHMSHTDKHSDIEIGSYLVFEKKNV